MTQGEPIWIYRVGETCADIEQLASELIARGKTVTGPTDDLPTIPISLLVVAIAAEASVDQEALESELDPWREQLVPVVEGSAASAILGKLSQLILGDLPMSKVVERIALLSEVGGSTLAALVRLEGVADQWIGAGRTSTRLLRGPTVDDAMKTIGASSATASAHVHEFVRASLEARRRRSLLFRSISAAVAGILVTGSIIALVQRQDADASAALAQTRARAAQSVRLSGLATTLLGSDPDLPWILTAQALHESLTTEAVSAARQVVQTVPAHRSIELPGLPRSMASDATTGAIVLRYVDGSTDVRDGADGRRTHHFAADPADSISPAAIAPGGKVILIGKRFVDVDSGHTVRALTGTFCGWAGTSSALVVNQGDLSVLDIQTGSTDPTHVTLKSPDAVVCSLAAKAPIATLLDGNRVLSVDLRTGEALAPATVEVPDRKVGIATSDDGSTVYVALEAGAKGFQRTNNGLVATHVSGHGEMVVSSGSNWLVGFNMLQTTQVGVSSGTISEQYLAHRGPITGIGALPGGRTATCGADQYLRLWEAPPAIAYPEPAGGQILSTFATSEPLTRVFYRPQVALSKDGSTITVSDPDTGAVDVLDSSNLTKLRAVFPGSMFGSVPVTDQRALVFNQLAGRGDFYVVDVPAGKVVWRSSVGNLLTGFIIGTASDDGARAAFASPQGMVSKGADGSQESTQFSPSSTPIWVGLVGGTAIAVTSGGTVYREKASPTSLSELGSPAVAATAGPTGDVFIVSSNGTLAEQADGQLRVIGHLSTTLGAYAMRVSEDESRVAVLGSSGGIIVSAKDGSTILNLSPIDDRDSHIRDVALGGNTAWEIRADGGVLKVPLTSEKELSAWLDHSAPRPENETENRSLSNLTTTIGAD
ncbi:hypothetical protein [Arthrobacter sp. GAS37]|uniref:hypothetical protein n=1 Tax=Arthrobacter sp. GAS37 TaxID=3156261 RepID=UPI00384F8F00